jgi:hypothetical protein
VNRPRNIRQRVHGAAGAVRGPAIRAAVATAALVLVVAVAQASASQRTPRVVSSSGGTPRYAGFQRRPFRIVYSGDGAALLAGTGSTFNHLTWTSWAGGQGRGRGADWHDNCVPDCANGTYAAYPVNVIVDRPELVGGYLLFTRMTTTYTAATPPYPAYRHRSVTYKLDYNAQYNTFFWNLG